MKTLSTAERDWTARERELAEEIRATGADVKVTVKNGRRVFSIIAAENGERPVMHLGGAVKIRNTTPGMHVLRGVKG
jgi:hypothetical protein